MLVLSGLSLFLLGAAGVENRGPVFAGLMIAGIVLMYIGGKKKKPFSSWNY